MKFSHTILAILLFFSLSLNAWFLNYFQLSFTEVVSILPSTMSTAASEPVRKSPLKNAPSPTETKKTATYDVVATKSVTVGMYKDAQLDTDSTVMQSLLRHFNQAIANQEFRLAAEYLQQIQAVDINLMARAKTTWLENLAQNIQSNMFLRAEKSINAFLEFKFDDIEFLTYKVSLFEAQKDYSSAIKSAYDIQYYLFDSVAQDKSIQFARQVAQEEIKRLAGTSQWLDILALLETIQAFDPQFDFYHWHMANALFQLGEFERSLNSLAPLLSHSNYIQPANNLVKQIEKALIFGDEDNINIPLTPIGEHFIVTSIVDDNVSMRLLIDTGASITTITQQKFNEISQYSETRFIRTQKFSTAGGLVYSNIYQVERFQVGGIVLENFNLSVNEQLMSGADDGLLGMNFLNQFDFRIDQTKPALVLSEK